MRKFRKCPQTLEKMNDNYRIHWPNLIQGKVIRSTADLLHALNEWHPTLLNWFNSAGRHWGALVPGALLCLAAPAGWKDGLDRAASKGGSEQSSPRDGYCPGMCARPHFTLLSRRQGARAARDRSGSGRKRQDNAAGAGRTMAVCRKTGQVS